MFKKSSDTSYALARLNSSKWLLLACTAFSAVVDAVIIVLLAIGGTDAKFFVCPAVLLALDIIFFLVSLFLTNFRFKYSVGLWVAYVIIYIIVFAVGNIVTSGSESVVLTNGAVGLWAGVHVFTVICAIVTALFASRKLTNRAVVGVFAALLAVSCCFYAVFMFINGYFGQGAGVRPVVYEYNEDSGEYTAVGVLGGYGTKVTVPETFNGARVSSVSANLLTGNGLKEIYLEGEKKIVDENALDFNADLCNRKIYADKAQVLTLRSAFYNIAKDAHKAGALDLANSVYPRDLDESEGYVAFNYDERAFALSNGALIPMYIGDLAEFNATSYVASYPYAVHRDINSVSDLDWAFKNFGGYIVSDIVGGNKSLFGGTLTESTSFGFSTQKIFRVTVGSGNDEMYDVTEKHPEFCKDAGFDFRYLAEGNSESFLSGLSPRKGFDLGWEYIYGLQHISFVSFKNVLDSFTGSDLTISPRWALKAPVITYARTDAENNTIVYGQDVSFSSAATIEADGVDLEYGWYYGGSTMHIWNDTKSFKLSSDELAGGKPAVTQSGDYKLVVTATGGATSLEATATAIVHLTINPKPVRFEWQVVENGTPIDGEVVYNGEYKQVVVTFDSSQWVNNISWNFTVSERNGGASTGSIYPVNKAGTYYFTVSMSEALSNRYNFADTSTYNLTINKAAVTADWSVEEGLTYSGNNYCPTATCTGYKADGNIIQSVEGAAKNAGTHTATAVLNNNNYTLTNPMQTFVIGKAPLTVTARAVTVTYGNTPVGNGYDCTGLVGGDIASAAVGGTPAYTFKYKDANDTAYQNGVEISGLTSNNYEITYAAGPLTINKRTVTLAWSGTTNLVYNGEAKNVTAVITNKVAGDDISVTVTGGNDVNAGEHTATATLAGEAVGNYQLAQNSTTYTIAKAKVKITAQNKTSVEGQPLAKLTATVEGTIYNEEELTYTLKKEPGETAGTYAITVIVTASENYEVTTVDATYTITAAPEEENEGNV